MSERLLLDTHVWLWMSLHEEKIGPAQTARLREASLRHGLYISAITLYEVANLASRNRIDLLLPIAAWFDVNLTQPSVTVLPVTPRVAVATTELPAGFHGDPNDRIVAATAIAHGMVLCTHDRDLLRYGRQSAYQFLEI